MSIKTFCDICGKEVSPYGRSPMKHIRIKVQVPMYESGWVSADFHPECGMKLWNMVMEKENDDKENRDA